MASKLEEQRVFMVALSQGEAILENDEQYAFAAGQVIYYLLHKSKTADKSYKRLEPFLQQVHASGLSAPSEYAGLPAHDAGRDFFG